MHDDITRYPLAKTRSEQKPVPESEIFRLLVETLQEYAVFLVSPDGLVQSWNAGAQRLKRYRAEEVIGTSYDRFFPEEVRALETPRTLVQRVARDGEAGYEGLLIRKDGSSFWGTLSLSAIRDEHGRLKAISNVAKDLTDHKRTELALTHSEERLRLMVDSLHDYAFFMVSPDGRVTSWNSGAERLKGYKENEVIGKPLSIFFPDSKTPDEMRVCALAEGRGEYEGLLIRKDGSTFWSTCILNPVTDDGGELHGFTNISRDITASKRFATTQTFLSEVGPILAGSLDPQTTVHAIARLALREIADWCVIDVEEEDGLRRLALAHTDPEREKWGRDAVHRGDDLKRYPAHGICHVVRTGQSVLQRDLVEDAWLAQLLGFEPSVLHKLGAHSCMCVPLTARGRTFGAMTFMSDGSKVRYDVQDLAAAEELARRAALAMDNADLFRKARQAVRAREELISMASHDLGAPMAGMKLYLENLISQMRARGEEPIPAQEIVPRLEALLTEGTRAIEMLNTLLDASRISADGDTRGFGVGLWIVHSIVQEHGGTVQVDSDPGAGATFTVELPVAKE